MPDDPESWAMRTVTVLEESATLSCIERTRGPYSNTLILARAPDSTENASVDDVMEAYLGRPAGENA